MKKSILNLMSEYQQKSIGHIGVLSYQYSNLCVKADGSSLLGVEINDEDATYHIEDLAYVKLHTEEGDDDKIDIIPKNGDDDLELIAKGVIAVHPEFVQSVEEMENEQHMLRLTMPVVNKDRKDVLEDGIKLCYDECKTKLDALSTYYTGAIDVQLVGETKEVVESIGGNMKTVKDKFEEICEQLKTDKLKELEDAYQRYLSNESETQDPLTDSEKGEYHHAFKVN